MKEEKKRKIAIALSGGIDSAVAAALMKEKGEEITGVHMKLWEEKSGKKTNFSEKKAREVAKYLKIPFLVFDFRKEFKKEIVGSFLEEFKKCQTPNPCILCNKKIKFGLLLKRVLSLGFDYLATGHYARKEEANSKGKKIYKLMRAKDKSKDQSYFLWKLSQNQLRSILFPLGNYGKKEVKKIAKERNLPVAGMPESKEICFVKSTMNEFLLSHLQAKAGKIINEKGKIVGRHQGLFLYTVGQRKNIQLSQGPYYVLGKEKRKNILIVTKEEKKIYRRELRAKNVHWLSKKISEGAVKAQIRYQHSSALAIIKKEGKGSYLLKFKRRQRAITPGQSVVFYSLDNKELLGGGIIV